jgi:hypothetical protein
VVVLALTAGLVVAGADVALQRWLPHEAPILEVADGLADLRSTDPRVVVLGSSHARSFAPVRRAVGPEDLVVVPAEGGTFFVFDWILQNRLRPALAQKTRLERLVLVTTYWDMCPAEHAHFEGNLASRSWTLRHYLADVWTHGLSGLNRNFVQARFKQLAGASILARERAMLPTRIREHLRPPDLDERFAHRIAVRRGEMEGVEWDLCWDPEGRAAFNRIVDYAREREIALSVVLFPLVQETITQKSRATTLERYRAWVTRRAAESGFEVLDLTFESPLVRDDFETDCDHVTPAGNEIFSKWALAGPLSHLRGPR